jgi:hypothetical protein
METFPRSVHAGAKLTISPLITPSNIGRTLADEEV